MSQSFRKLFYQIRIYPIFQLMLAGYLLFIILAYVLPSGLCFLFALVWVILFSRLDRAANGGRPACLATALTPNFYAVRCLGGRWSIFQRRRKKRLYGNRRTYLKELAAEQRLLPAALKPGQYQTLTHDTVLRRLMAMENAADIQVTPAYRAALQAPWGRGFSAGGQENKRQFYLVRFTLV